jgi:hypothetical protein
VAGAEARRRRDRAVHEIQRVGDRLLEGPAEREPRRDPR